ncbi:hypothetical protein BKA83DRAFT_4317509 [Pisolithus microcarpus]|nr:hypothetical protein BKA83DRAFT_4317509 [Pisolithus microcarpus]
MRGLCSPYATAACPLFLRRPLTVRLLSSFLSLLQPTSTSRIHHFVWHLDTQDCLQRSLSSPDSPISGLDWCGSDILLI